MQFIVSIHFTEVIHLLIALQVEFIAWEIIVIQNWERALIKLTRGNLELR